LGESYKNYAQKLKIEENPFMFFYTLKSKDKAVLHIIKKDGFQLVNSIEIEHLNFYLESLIGYEFYQLTDDHTQLIIHTGYEKNQNLLFIDPIKGAVTSTIKLNRYKNKTRLSSDQKYVIVEDLQKKILTFIDTQTHETVQNFNLGSSKLFGEIFNNAVYLIKFYEKGNRKHYGLQHTDLISKETTQMEYDSREKPVLIINKNNNQILLAGTSFNGVKLMVHELNGSVLNKIGTTDAKFKPNKLNIDNKFNNLLLQGAGDIATLNLDNPLKFTVTDLPFDTVTSMYNSTGELLFIKEGSGSEVAVIDVNSGKLIERSGTGRKGVKFGQFMASVALAGVGANFGYMVYFAKYSNTGLTLNHNEDKLYVINSKTSDVTHFNAQDLSDRKAIATGSGTFLVHQGHDANAPLWVFSNKQITQIDDQSFELENEIEFENFIGIDFEEDYFIIKTTKNILTYDMKTGNVTKQWPMSDANIIWSEN
jgi:DNA-binding beta-propeller fold protein YncE